MLGVKCFWWFASTEINCLKIPSLRTGLAPPPSVLNGHCTLYLISFISTLAQGELHIYLEERYQHLQTLNLFILKWILLNDGDYPVYSFTGYPVKILVA